MVREGFPKEVTPELQADGYVGHIEVKPNKKGRGIPGRGCPVGRPEAGLDRVPQSNQK